jgi:hypothetical protein
MTRRKRGRKRAWMDDMGLVLSGHAMLWGYKHGALRWTPHWFRHMIVTLWNYVSCRLFGHDVFGPIIEDGHVLHDKVCVNCSKKYPFDVPDREATDLTGF